MLPAIRISALQTSIGWRAKVWLLLMRFARTRSVRRADDDFYHMWFTQLDDVGAMVIGLATSEYGIEWEKADAPFLVPDAESDWDRIYCSNASVVIEPDGRDKLYYASRIDMQHKYFAIGLAVREG